MILDFYKECQWNAFRYFGVDLNDFGRMTISEYHLRFKKFKETRVDNLREMHLQAWLNNAVTSKKKNGKKLEPVYKKFDEFWDESKYTESEPKIVDQKLNQLLLSANLSIEKGGN